MPKVKKNGKLPKQKPKSKPERKDNIKSSTTKSKSIAQHQNVNVNVSIVKKSGNKSKTSSSSVPATSQVKAPQYQPPPQPIYYQQLRDTRTPEIQNNELVALLRDMNKELYSQRNIQASNQSPLINQVPLPQNNPLVEDRYRLPKPIPDFVGGNNPFEDEPFEEHHSDTASSHNSSNSRTTHLKVVPDVVPAIPIYTDWEKEAGPSHLSKLLVATTPKKDLLTDQPNTFVEQKRLFDEFGEPLTKKEIPVEIPEEYTVTEKKNRAKVSRQTTLPFTSPKQLPAEENEVGIKSDFTEEAQPTIVRGNRQKFISIFKSKKELDEAYREDKVAEIRRIEEALGINLGYEPNMRMPELYSILNPYVPDGRKNRRAKLRTG